MKLLLLLLLIFGNVFIFHSSSMVNPEANQDETDTEDDDDETETEDTEDDDEDDNDSDDDGIDDDTEKAYEREIEVEEADYEWKIKSKLKNGEQKDEFQAEFKVGDKPEIKMEYKSESDSIETEMKYRVDFDEIIEFTNNGTAGYSKGNDTIVSNYELDKVDWNSINYTTEVVNGSTIYTATAQTTDGVFTLVLKLSTGFAQLDNSVITPNAIKIDIIIDGYTYVGTDTYLALQTDIKTESETEVDEDSDDEEKGLASNETQINVNAGSTAGFFSWVEFAQADGVDVDIISSNPMDSDEQDDDLEEGENQQVMFFTFDILNPDTIVWDPKVGVDNDQFVEQQRALTSGTTISDSSSVSNGIVDTSASVPFPLLGLIISLAIPVMIRRRYD